MWITKGTWSAWAKPGAGRPPIAALADKAAELGKGYDNSLMFISHGDCREDAQALAELVKERCGVKEVYINYVGAVVGSPSGPGTLALFFWVSTGNVLWPPRENGAVRVSTNPSFA